MYVTPVRPSVLLLLAALRRLSVPRHRATSRALLVCSRDRWHRVPTTTKIKSHKVKRRLSWLLCARTPNNYPHVPSCLKRRPRAGQRRAPPVAAAAMSTPSSGLLLPRQPRLLAGVSDHLGLALPLLLLLLPRLFVVITGQTQRRASTYIHGCMKASQTTPICVNASPPPPAPRAVGPTAPTPPTARLSASPPPAAEPPGASPPVHGNTYTRE